MNTEILVIEDDDLVRQGIVDILELRDGMRLQRSLVAKHS